MKKEEVIKMAVELREKGREEQNQDLIQESRKMLFELLKKDINNPEINYHIGVTFDNSGYTKDAIPYYERAIEYGLNMIDLERCYLGLGSSYRLLGNYEDAKKIYELAVKEYPQNRAIQTFLSITYYNLGEYKRAMELALGNLIETSNDEKIKFFSRPLKYYSEHLDEIWDSEYFIE